MTARQHIKVGDIVQTNDGTGPYYIAEIHGPSTRPHFLGEINGIDTPSEPHFYFRCGWAGAIAEGHIYEENYFLNGYRLDGTNVWSDDRLTVIGQQAGVQLDLLAVQT